MKNLLRIMAFIGLLFMCMACTSDSSEVVQIDNIELQVIAQNDPCVDEDPITRVVNNGTTAFDLNVLDEDGNNVVSILNIPPNSTTSWASFTQGEMLFSLSTNTAFVNDDKVLLQMDNCMAFEIEIDANNEIVSYTPTIL